MLVHSTSHFVYRLESDNGSVAQRLEQGTHNPLVLGSNPSAPNFAEGKIEQWSGRTVLSRRKDAEIHCGLLIY
jgi:hypothetical protein